MKQFALILILIATMSQVAAQNDSIVVRPVTPSIPFQTIMFQYLYVETSWAQYDRINTAGNSFNTGYESLYRNSFGIGLRTNFSFLSYKRLSTFGEDFSWTLAGFLYSFSNFALNIGYTHDRFSYEQDRWNDAGYHSHWLTFEIGWYALHFLYIGLRSDIYLGSSSVSPDGWSYNGINPDCYKRVNFIAPIFGIKLTYSNIFMELLFEYSAYNNFDEKKLLMYNSVWSSLYPKNLNLQIRIGIRNFTNSNKSNL